jgi:hypothetical protein
MRSALVAFCALAIMAAFVLAGYFAPHAEAATGPIPLNCNRACLESLVDQYLAALVAHDPKRLPLSADVKYSENDQLIDLGDGFWKTVEGRGNYKHIWVDPDFGQVAMMGTMREAGGPILISLRLRVQLGRITEIETVLFKPGSGGPNSIATMDAPFKPEDMWFKSIPPAQQMSRQELISVADGYFTGLQKNDGKGIGNTGTYPFTDDCSRIENGSYTAKAPPRNPPPADGIDAFAMDCMGQFKLGYYFVVQNIHHRRYPVVDRERGVVWSHVVFDQGTVNKGVLSTGKTYEFKGFNRPSSILVTEAFLIENSKIRRVEMVGNTAPYHTNGAWPGGLSGN